MSMTRRQIGKWIGLGLFGAPALGGLTLALAAPGALERERAAARREGLPLLPEDLRPNPPIPDDQNAGPLLKELTQRYQEMPFQQQKAWEYASRDLLKNPDDPKARAAFREGLDRFAPLLHLAERAVARPHCDFAYDWSRGINHRFPEFTTVRDFARAFVGRAAIANDPDAAWADIARAARLGNLVGETPILISALVAVAMHAIAHAGYVITLKRFGPSVTAWKTHEAFGPAPDPERYLGGELVTMTATMRLLREGKLRQRAAVGDGAEEGAAWSSLSPMAPVITPFFERQMIAFWREAFAALRSAPGDHPEMQRRLNVVIARWEKSRMPQDILVRILVPVFTHMIEKISSEPGTQRQLRETALALLEAKAASGAFPDAPDLPIDPFSGKPLVYRKEGKGCLLYSVGSDRADNGGREKSDRDSPGRDLVIRL